MTDFKLIENIFENSQQGHFPKRFTFENNQFVLYKKVFSPLFFKGSSVYISHLPLKKDQTMLDMGCGSGIIGIMAYKKYQLKKVVCVDISGCAVRNTLRNIKLHHLENKVFAFKSDVFANIDQNQKFDLIFWNAPYFDGKKKGNPVLYKSMYDRNYQHIKKFIIDGQTHLNKNGKIMLGFSSSNFPLDQARRLINEIGFDIKIYFRATDKSGRSQEILEIIKSN